MSRKSIKDRREMMRWGEEDKHSSSGVDLEMFGKMVRYNSIVSDNMLCNYFKDLSYANMLWETMASTIVNTANGQNPIPSITEYISFLEDGLEALKLNAETGLSTVASRVVVTDISVENDSSEFTRLSGISSINEIELNNFLLHNVDATDETKNILERLHKVNQGYFDMITTIRKTIIDNLIVVD